MRSFQAWQSWDERNQAAYLDSIDGTVVRGGSFGVLSGGAYTDDWFYLVFVESNVSLSDSLTRAAEHQKQDSGLHPESSETVFETVV